MLLSWLHSIAMLNFMKFGGHLLFYLILQSWIDESLKLKFLEKCDIDATLGIFIL